MDDRDQHAPSSEIKARINQARAKTEKGSRREESAKSVGMRVGIELLGGVLFGVLTGVFLDRWLGTAPWLLIVMLFLGIGAGIRNVIRTAQEQDQKYRDQQNTGPQS